MAAASSAPFPDLPELELEIEPDELRVPLGILGLAGRLGGRIGQLAVYAAELRRRHEQHELELERLRRELDELRAADAALANRISSTDRVLASRTDHLA